MNRRQFVQGTAVALTVAEGPVAENRAAQAASRRCRGLSREIPAKAVVRLRRLRPDTGSGGVPGGALPGGEPGAEAG
jgi:hypothetical protein